MFYSSKQYNVICQLHLNLKKKKSPYKILEDFKWSHLLIFILSCVRAKLPQLCLMLWTVACQALLSMGFSRQEYWSGYFLLQGIFPTQGSNAPPGKPLYHFIWKWMLTLEAFIFCFVQKWTFSGRQIIRSCWLKISMKRFTFPFKRSTRGYF